MQQARAASIAYRNNRLKQQTNNTAAETGISNQELALTIDPGASYDEHHIFDMVLQGYPVSDIAENLNISADVVKTSIRKGMKLKAKRN